MSLPLFRAHTRLRAKTSLAGLAASQKALGGTLEVDLENSDARKAVYLLTFSHPKQARSACGVQLQPPESFTRERLLEALHDVLANPVYNNVGNQAQGAGSGVVLLRCVVASEFHEADESGVQHRHYHVALQATETFRFLPFKRSFLARWGLASHWSSSKLGYWSAVKYLVMASPKKPLKCLDPIPLAWHKDGEHQNLVEAAQPPTNAAMLEARRNAVVQAAAEEGREEPRPREIDIWPLIVKNNIRNGPDNQKAHLRLIQVARKTASPAMAAYLFKIRDKLSKLIDDVWTWEEVDDHVLMSERSCMAALIDAMFKPCVCGGAWPEQVRCVLGSNGICAAELAHDIYKSFQRGRSETTPVVVLAGAYGGEGKSIILFPIPAVLGDEYVQGHTNSGSFPLLGLEGKKIVILDEWRFAASALPLGIQLLWFEGKPVPLARPQGEYIGHLMYRGTAPIFITCPQKRLDKLYSEAAAARSAGVSSEATMLLRRLKVHYFNVPLPTPLAQIPACAACFANFVFQGEMMWSDTGS